MNDPLDALRREYRAVRAPASLSRAVRVAQSTRTPRVRWVRPFAAAAAAIIAGLFLAQIDSGVQPAAGHIAERGASVSTALPSLGTIKRPARPARPGGLSTLRLPQRPTRPALNSNSTKEKRDVQS